MVRQSWGSPDFEIIAREDDRDFESRDPADFPGIFHFSSSAGQKDLDIRVSPV